MAQKINESTFQAVKILLETGNTQAEIANFMKLSTWAVSNISRAETYEEYKAINYERVKAYRAKQAEEKKTAQETPAPQVVEHHQTVTIQATHYMMQELQETNKLLKGISAKLAYIVEDLCGVKDKTVDKDG